MEIKSEQLWSLVKPRLRSYMGHAWDFGLVARMTGSTTQTVTGWLADQTPPGERLIRLWHILEAVGIESPELKELPSFNHYCGELLTFDVVNMKELQAICNLANPQGVLSMLRGTPILRQQHSVEELHELYDATLQTLRADLQRVDVSQTKTQLQPTKTSAERPVSTVDIEGSGPSNVLFAASMLCSVLPLVRHLDSDDCSPEQRSDLRRLVGSQEMFDLSNHLNNLCSERARKHGRTGQ